ncbi:MAG: CDP-alcohol phosphatidyltransferase family protein [Anaerolineae bacterium]
MKAKYRYLVPNGITFLSLACGVVSILLSASGHLQPAGILILASYILDLFDGATARRLQAGSEFGLQLDSLVDMVSLGTAPAVLAHMHLLAEGVDQVWVWPVVVFVALAGAFRLARFNLLPPKPTGNTDSVGLTISTGGATITLAVLSDLAVPGEVIPDIAFVPLLAFIGLLMVSKIAFPSFRWVFSGKRKNALLVFLFGVSLLKLSFFNAWFLWTNAYLGISLARAGYRNFR